MSGHMHFFLLNKETPLYRSDCRGFYYSRYTQTYEDMKTEWPRLQDKTYIILKVKKRL